MLDGLIFWLLWLLRVGSIKCVRTASIAQHRDAQLHEQIEDACVDLLRHDQSSSLSRPGQQCRHFKPKDYSVKWVGSAATGDWTLVAAAPLKLTLLKLPQSLEMRDIQEVGVFLDGKRNLSLQEVFPEGYNAVQIKLDNPFRFGHLLFRFYRNFTLHPWSTEPRAGPDIYLIILDSTSRGALRRYAPRVTAFFERNHGHHRSYVFRRFHTISAGGTRSTLYPMLNGGAIASPAHWCSRNISSDEVMGARMTQNTTLPILRGCFEPHRRIYHRAKANGFVSAVSSCRVMLPLLVLPDDVDYYFPAAMCREWSLHGHLRHSCRDFYCMGDRSYAETLFEAHEKFFLAYADKRKILATHIESAKVNGFDLANLEAGLLAHLKRFVKLQQFRSTVLILMGDHGHEKPDLIWKQS